MADFTMEKALGGRVAGIDEVGRGPLAGPVFAAAVVLTPAAARTLGRLGLTDSKALPRKKREALAIAVTEMAEVSIGVASVEEIDRLNILQAAMLAMRRAAGGLGTAPNAALVDGNRDPGLVCATQAVVGGDGLCLSIAAASVVAKIARDRLMCELAAAHPGFGWERNAGYGTAEHLAALARLGVTPHHRRSFGPVARLLIDSNT